MAGDCSQCSFRAKYDRNRKSWLGRFWRWHINFCPGWKKYFLALPDDEREQLAKKYDFWKYRS
ncbi:hypothetical protein SAMN05660653_02088 [Desulfonatronum thiosulfatophilum]|uniref:Uncharacterized protein n=1 Tax=Desulfonatronum thiosulfatophilum TaxID=617002 RepID=A0A1G6DDU2_9BACT|nr:hypothetical protein [Desulfonatronum thiosulfatophilum]SDB43290.1 hypothetical protein SAMN05660653_02088 [Desulfonatronum thiosulfatophilum]